MKYSYNWLQTHIANKLPTPADIERILTKHAFEVEEVTEIDDDYLFDIKVLPDRSHDALSHLGMARELTSLYNWPQSASSGFIEPEYDLPVLTGPAPDCRIEAVGACKRFMAMRISNVKITQSTGWLKTSLETIGQRPINAAVDVTNYVLYDLGKPMHVFDADKVVGAISARFARAGERITTLDNKDVALDESILVIADEVGPLALAGIKGGKRAEVDLNTKNIIIESTNFESSLIRRSSSKLGIKTDAARRFENGISSSMCKSGIEATAALLLQHCGTASTTISNIVDVYPEPENWDYTVGITTKNINKILGTSLTDQDTERLLMQRGLSFNKKSLSDVLTTEAESLLGALYKIPSSMRQDAPSAFSCSSFVSFLYVHAGIAMPSLAIDKYVFSQRVGRDELRRGDLVFYNSGIGKVYTETVEYMKGTQVKEGVDHVALYMGDNTVLHPTKASGMVVKSLLDELPLADTIVGYGRIVHDIYEERYVVQIPAERLDLRITEDLVDELGKLIGTDELMPTRTYENSTLGLRDTTTRYTSALRRNLIAAGFSEVMTYTFAEEGDIAILNSVDQKKNKLRTSLLSGMKSTLEKGLYNMAFLGTSELIKAFEIGTVFADGIESHYLAIGLASKNKKLKKDLSLQVKNAVVAVLVSVTGASSETTEQEYEKQMSIVSDETQGIAMIEIDLSTMLRTVPAAYIGDSTQSPPQASVQYKTLSSYPFITRDIAFFVQAGTDMKVVENELQIAAGPLCVKFYSFDEFKREGKISYGYRFVFQAFDRTLQDSEVQPLADALYLRLQSFGFEIR
jgi:phenylalanyl-tRNA synthetase beta subunit